MLWIYKTRSARPTAYRTILGTECLDARVLPSTTMPLGMAPSQFDVIQIHGVNFDCRDDFRHPSSLTVTGPIFDVKSASAIDAPTGLHESLPPNLHAGHVRPYGSKPGGTGDGVSGEMIGDLLRPQ